MIKDINKARKIIMEIDFKYNSESKKIKWNDIYNSINEILEDLEHIHIPKKMPYLGMSPLYKGYEYINSFAKQVQNGKTLSEKQITQCKRLALEIKKAYSIKDCY